MLNVKWGGYMLFLDDMGCIEDFADGCRMQEKLTLYITKAALKYLKLDHQGSEVVMDEKNATVSNNSGTPRKAIFSFVSPSDRDVMRTAISFKVQTRNMAKALQKHRWFDEGDLLGTMEKGVLFPIIHYSEVTANGNKPPMSLRDPSVLGQEYSLKQGLYVEVKHVCPPILYKPPNDGLVRYKACIFMGFKKLDSHFSEDLEDNWKNWTGARLVYLNLSDEFGLTRLSFYRRLAPNDIDMFMYIMTVECSMVTKKNEISLLDYVQRLRVERMTGYLSLYKVDQLVPSTANVINGLLAEAVDNSDKDSI